MTAAAFPVGDVEKAELHCHVDGLLDPSLLDALLACGVSVPVSRVELAAVHPVHSFKEWTDRYFPLVEPAMRDKACGLLPILVEHVRRLRAQRVTYAEIMLNGMLWAYPDVGKVVDLFRLFRQAVDEVAGDGLRMEFLVAVARGPLDKIERQAERILAIRKAGLIRGFALAGDERACSVQSMAHVLDRLRDSGMGIEIHAGEFAGSESVRDALDHGRPDRLGHAVGAFADPALVEDIHRRDIHVEFCLTSNLRLGAVPSIEDHPIRLARDAGIRFSLNTDDPGPFGCSMNSEFALAAETYGFGAEEFARIRRDALTSAFGGR